MRDAVREELPDNIPDERAEDIWAEALTGNSEYSTAVVGEKGPEKNYTAVIAANESILDETLNAVDIEGLKSTYEHN